MGLGLVLGGGGVVGIAYHAGVLKALHDTWGLGTDQIDLIVGTSAGSVVGAYLRTGREPAELIAEILGPDGTEAAKPMPQVLDWNSDGLLGWARRGVGNAFVVGRSAVRLPIPPPPELLRRAFPAGLAAMREARDRLRSDLPATWPETPLWLTTVDLVSGRRVVLGRGGPPRLSLPDAVRASCAIPVLYPPVAMGRRILVDGGLQSAAHLDLVADPEAGVDAAIVVLPLSYNPRVPPGPVESLARRPGSRALAREMEAARRARVSLLLIRPDAEVVRAQGPNMMRTDGLHLIVQAAYEATCRQLTSPDSHVVRMRRRLAA